MNKELLKLLPNEIELAKLSKKLQATVTSREQLLVQIGGLKLSELGLEEKMVYVLGLVSLGFDEKRARKRMEVKNSEFYIWKQDERHVEMLESAIARGEMVLEEKVLVEAENNPKMAFELLKERQRREEKKEDREIQAKQSVWDIMKESAQDRGVVQDAELIDEVLK